MPVILDPDAAAIYRAFQEAGRPAYETLSPAEAREFYLAARFVANPEPPELQSVKPLAIPAPHGRFPRASIRRRSCARPAALRQCWYFFTAEAG